MTATIRPFARVGEGAQPPYLHRDYGSTVKRAAAACADPDSTTP